MFALARLLDRVPVERFDMKCYVNKGKQNLDTASVADIKRGCGYTACACGWAITLPSIYRITTMPTLVAYRAFGMNWDTEKALFGFQRNVGPRQVARDLRAYLNDGTLP